MKKVLLAVVVLCVLVFAVASCTSNQPSKVGEKTSTAEQAKNNAKTEEKEIFKIGDIVEVDDCKITLLSAEEYNASGNSLMHTEDGNIFYRVEFEVENLGETIFSISQLNFTGYADDYDVDYNIYGDDTISANLSTGKKTKGYIYFEIPKETESLEIEYRSSIVAKNIVVFKAK